MDIKLDSGHVRRYVWWGYVRDSVLGTCLFMRGVRVGSSDIYVKAT